MRPAGSMINRMVPSPRPEPPPTSADWGPRRQPRRVRQVPKANLNHLRDGRYPRGSPGMRSPKRLRLPRGVATSYAGLTHVETFDDSDADISLDLDELPRGNRDAADA